MSSLTHHTDFLHQLSPIRKARMLATLNYLLMPVDPGYRLHEKYGVNDHLVKDLESVLETTCPIAEQSLNDLVKCGLARIPQGTLRLEITDRGYSILNEYEEGQPHG